MTKKISTKDVQYIADLARIHLKEDELTVLTENLEGILEYIEKLQKADVSQVEPTTHVLPLQNVFREDIVRPSLGQNASIQHAPAKHNGAFKVPQVIE